MPELPEVHTTVQGLNHVLKDKKIVDVWSGYNSKFYRGKNDIKNIKYLERFKKDVVGGKFVSATRRGKNILIHLSNGQTILIHMKMTGHLLYGHYEFKNKTGTNKNISGDKKNIEQFWQPTEDGPLQDPYNQFIRLLFSLSDGKHLAFSDVRKFGKIFAFSTKNLFQIPDLSGIGPEPLDINFNLKKFKERLLLSPKGKIKSVLMDQSIVAGIGNIYSDEILWSADVHPLSTPEKIPPAEMKKMFEAMKTVLKRGINFGGDSESDYRNIDGKPGGFQLQHKAYRHTGEPCARRDCNGIVEKMKIGGRSAHFCAKHQKIYGR